jgi:hypothetical protein
MSWGDLQPATSFKMMSSTKSGSFKVAADNGAAAGDAAECVNGDGVVLEQGPTCLPPADPANTVQGKCTASRREWEALLFFVCLAHQKLVCLLLPDACVDWTGAKSHLVMVKFRTLFFKPRLLLPVALHS